MQPISILLVEDNPGDVALLRSALRKSAIPTNLVVAGDGAEALDVFYRRHGHENDPAIDMALFDINLPGMSGLELLAQVKADADLCSTPVVMLTSSSAPGDIEQAYQHHANSYVTKPTGVAELTSLVEALESFWFSLARLPTRN